MNIAVLDIEAKQLVQDWDKPWEAGVSWVSVWISWRGGPWGTWVHYTEENLDRLPDLLRAADVVVTWNGKRYDIPALEHFTGKLPIKHHCDLFAELLKVTGLYVSLERCARPTLHRGKSGHGDAAPDMHQREAWGKLSTYCGQDVALTRDVFLFALEHGFVWIVEKGKSERFPVPLTLKAGGQPVKNERRQTIWHKAAGVRR